MGWGAAIPSKYISKNISKVFPHFLKTFFIFLSSPSFHPPASTIKLFHG